MTTPNRRYLRSRGLPDRVTHEELQGLLAGHFDAEIKGFNPLPPFPYFLPNRLLARVPGIWRVLEACMERGIAMRHSCSFVARGVKR